MTNENHVPQQNYEIYVNQEELKLFLKPMNWYANSMHPNGYLETRWSHLMHDRMLQDKNNLN